MQDMERLVARVGQAHEESPVVAPSAESLDDVVSRLRMVEEDRDSLEREVMSLQKTLDKERKTRLEAQEAQKKAIKKLSEITTDENNQALSEERHLSELEAEAANLKGKLDAARKGVTAPSGDVMEALKERTKFMEHLAMQKEDDRQQSQKDLIKKLGITLKVLQLQKEHGDNWLRQRDKVKGIYRDATDHASDARNTIKNNSDHLDQLARRIELLYSAEVDRHREIASIKSLAEALHRQVQARSARYQQFEAGLAEDLKGSEYERGLHVQVMQEYMLEMGRLGGQS
eukprot:CAMPEP_0184291436 /NCGR_PEP_ID=MMETSP1049-20130417/3478_1 /TAXON_ID=77928 /ORGANISM="Proteomonas sulcata, Strain CCMP704" /LENGTH=286 /DNA_ID=CAMNT_0026598901 /DNA_START=344 /DNA_END=1204 /DNA_ORIENTATION=-